VNEHEQIRELIEAYALGALDAQERATLEAHLTRGCAECAKALEEARWAASQLAYLAPEAKPSELLKGRLLQTVRAEVGGRAAPDGGQNSSGAAESRGSVPWWLWAGVAALLLFSMYSTWNGRRLQQENANLQAQAEAQRQQRVRLEQELLTVRTQAHEAMIWSDPKSVKINLPAKDPKMPMLEAMWHPEMGLCVKGWNVPPAGKNRVLQLWLIPKKGGKPMPSTTFWPDASGTFTAMVENPPVGMAETQALAITEEPMGGSSQPTGTPMWVGGVT
jgi:anti-sigma-K factor RskA